MKTTINGNPKLFTRTEIKATLMQYGYGQQEKGSKDQLKEDMGDKYFDEVYDIFIQALDKVVPGFSLIMNFINSMWNPEWEEVTWHMPDGFKVTCKPTSSYWEDFKLFDKFPVVAKVSGVEKEKQALILYVGFIHSVDAYIAREMVRIADEQGFSVITIHDA